MVPRKTCVGCTEKNGNKARLDHGNGILGVNNAALTLSTTLIIRFIKRKTMGASVSGFRRNCIRQIVAYRRASGDKWKVRRMRWARNGEGAHEERDSAVALEIVEHFGLVPVWAVNSVRERQKYGKHVESGL